MDADNTAGSSSLGHALFTVGRSFNAVMTAALRGSLEPTRAYCGDCRGTGRKLGACQRCRGRGHTVVGRTKR